MKSVFDKAVREELTKRIHALSGNSQPLWGKMTVGQMLRHCCLCEEYYFGNIKMKRSFSGRLFGQKAIKAILKDEASTLRQNSPAPIVFQVHEAITNLDAEKQHWIALIERYALFNRDSFTHWFFGYMTKEQLGQFIYKHDDHHLKQFGV